ncbi:unnamed protein product [Cuscuta epithymum]|uniref:Myb-like domain-containing protein n=1 Tax=Cuscuta epithymum TaxID=186058 RepID=A0AAV0FUB1_9ASTE|nr:unnamed protein product [Cuscuta epithymum]
MNQRTSADKEQCTVATRRSTRFHPKNQQESEDPKTPDIKQREIRKKNPNKKPGQVTREAIQKSGAAIDSTNSFPAEVECSTKFSNTNGSIIPSSSSTGPRRSSRLNSQSSQAEDFTSLRRSPRVAGNCSIRKHCIDNNEKRAPRDDGVKVSMLVTSSNESMVNLGKRVTRSSFQPLADERKAKYSPRNTKKKPPRGWIRDCSAKKEQRLKVLDSPSNRNSDLSLKPDGVDASSSNKSMVSLEKRVTRSSSQPGANKRIAKHSSRSVMPSTSKLEKIETSPAQSSLEVAIKGRDKTEEIIDLGDKDRCVKRKKAKRGDGHFTITNNGCWTKEQELALRRAYISAKATPHFWKKVAKMVPGKSAQECFDRIHSDHMTPPQPCQRSRAKQATSLPLSSLSSSKLLQPANPKPKRHISKKALREMLNKQCKVDNHTIEKDLYSLLEEESTKTTDYHLLTSSSSEVLTPEMKLDRSSNFARLSNLAGTTTTLFSPPVLKPIKNKALHDRYIDQLLCREAKRKAAFIRKSKHNQVKDEVDQQKVDAKTIQAAKSALIFDARDAIQQFKNVQINQFGDASSDGEDYDGFGYNDDDDEED